MNIGLERENTFLGLIYILSIVFCSAYEYVMKNLLHKCEESCANTKKLHRHFFYENI